MALPNGGVALAPSPAQIAAKLDLSITLSLHFWPALSLAVQNSWGGPLSAEKRDWFAGAVSTLLADTPDADDEYVEEFLLQMMSDEFDVVVEDGSAEEVAARIVGFRKMCSKGEFEGVDELYRRWVEREGRNGGAGIFVDRGEVEEEGEWDGEDGEDGEDEDGDGDGDEEMSEAPALVKVSREKPPIEVDEEGFTKVAGRKKR